jgi:predicted DNA-binding WGR domain protein
MKRYFTYKDEKTEKFWSVDIADTTITIVYGKGHTLGVTHTKKMESPEEAEREVAKMIKDKVRNGYRETVEKVIEKLGQADFWNLIERAKSSSEDMESQVELLTEYLSQRTVEDIFEFKRIIDQLYAKSYLTNLWGAAFLMNAGCSDDGFDYFRGWLIAKGREVFQSALENPDNLAKYVSEDDYNFGEYESEEMMNVAANAFIAKTGGTLDDFYDSIPKNPRPELEHDWDFEDDDELKKRYPKLYKKFGG